MNKIQNWHLNYSHKMQEAAVKIEPERQKEINLLESFAIQQMNATKVIYLLSTASFKFKDLM